jgi:hypothetical protein
MKVKGARSGNLTQTNICLCVRLESGDKMAWKNYCKCKEPGAYGYECNELMGHDGPHNYCKKDEWIIW